MIGSSLGSTAVAVVAGFAGGLLVAAVLVAGRIGLERPEPAGVTGVPVVTASVPVTVTGLVSMPTTVTRVRSAPMSTTTTQTTVVTATSTEISTTSASPTPTSTESASPPPLP